jgi:hypothetical protein
MAVSAPAWRRVHVDVAAVHRDDAGKAELARGLHRGWPGRNGPMGMNDIGAALTGSGHGGAVLRLEVVGHDGDPRELADEVDPALGHPPVGQVHRQLHREPHDVHAVELLGGWQRGIPRRHDRYRVTPANQVTVDVVDVGGLGVGRVLGVPVGGANDPQRCLGPAPRSWTTPGTLDLYSSCRHLALTSQVHRTVRSLRERGGKINIYAT